MIQTMKTVKRVNFEDCDPFAHLNNANYLNYFLTAREEQLRTNGVLDIFKHAEESGNSWAVASHGINYLKPARLGEELEIWSRMLSTESFINLVEFVMLNHRTKQIKSVMHTRFAYFSIQKAKPVTPGKELKSLFRKIALFPDRKISTFSIDNRMEKIKSEAAQSGNGPVL